MYITVPKHISDKLVKLNGSKFKSKCLFSEYAKVGHKITNRNTMTFTSHNQYEPLRFLYSGLKLVNDIDNSNESDLHVDCIVTCM